MKEQCPNCDDYQGEADYDPDLGQFYTCAACGHQWHYTVTECFVCGGDKVLPALDMELNVIGEVPCPNCVRDSQSVGA